MNKEADGNALGLQQVLREIMHPTSTPNSYALSEDSKFQLSTSSIQSLQPDNETISTPVNPCHGVIDPAIGHHCMSNIDDPEFRIIKSSKGRDKLSFDGFIYNFHRDSKGKKQ